MPSHAPPTSPADRLLSAQYHSMRSRILSLAADLDRIHRTPGGPQTLSQHPQFSELATALQILLTPSPTPNRAEQVQLTPSDHTPPPIPPTPSRTSDT